MQTGLSVRALLNFLPNEKTMRASKKILIIIPGILVASLVAALMVVRNDLAWLLEQEPKITYEEFAVGKFTALEFPANWDVKVKQAREYKVEIATEGSAGARPKVENVEGTLLFAMTDSVVSTGRLRARITLPLLQKIKGGPGTKIDIGEFGSDSVSVSLENGGTFVGYNNLFKFLSLKSSGETSIQITDDSEN